MSVFGLVKSKLAAINPSSHLKQRLRPSTWQCSAAGWHIDVSSVYRFASPPPPPFLYFFSLLFSPSIFSRLLQRECTCRKRNSFAEWPRIDYLIKLGLVLTYIRMDPADWIIRSSLRFIRIFGVGNPIDKDPNLTCSWLS